MISNDSHFLEIIRSIIWNLVHELKSIISIIPVSFLIIHFWIHRVFSSFSCFACVCKLYTKPVTLTISNKAHSLITCSVVQIFDCNVFLSKLSSVFLTEEKSFTITSLLSSLERQCSISKLEWELSLMVPLNSRCFS